MGRKKSRFYQQQPNNRNSIVDTNAVVLEDIYQQQQQQQQEENEHIQQQSKPAMPTKREREFEKYMAKKMKKEARPVLFERLQALSGSDAKTLGGLQSTKQLVVHDARKDAKLARKTGPKIQMEESLEVIVEKTIYDNQQFISDSSDEEEASEAQVEKIEDLLNVPNKVQSLLNATEEIGSAVDAKLPIPSKPAYFVLVERKPEIQAQRELLPIFREEQVIMETIQENPVTLLCGETGSGKTTQVPQFLWEAGYGDPAGPHPGMIGITQPRRVAAISMANRVAVELDNANVEHRVAYQVRFDAETVRPDTRIKFMTEGVLLAEIANDFLIRTYSCIILDEAHERTVNTDLLIGMLSRIVRLRAEMSEVVAPLKLVIMSATLNVEQLASNRRLFDPAPPIINVPARQHPVQIHFSRRTGDESEYIQDAVKTVRKIHSKMPAGGILVFLTGKQEIWQMKRMLQAIKGLSTDADAGEGSAEDTEADDFEDCSFASDGDDHIDSDEDGESADRINGLFDNQEFVEMEENSESTMAIPKIIPSRERPSSLHILPLYAALPASQQMRVFDEASIPPNARLCVLATNVAETSLTIPGIRYVVDCGRVKERQWNSTTNATRFAVTWASQASANQRAGRAGRTGPGHCYRLYSSSLFDRLMPVHAVPEIERSPVESFILMAKSMGIDRVERFPLPSSPSLEAFQAGEALLVRLGAVNPETGKITDTGRLMAQYPVAPCWSRMLTKLTAAASAPLVLALVAVLSVGDPFEEFQSEDDPERGNKSRSAFVHYLPAVCDLLVWLNALLAYNAQPATKRSEFCQTEGLLEKRLKETLLLYQQLVRISAKVAGLDESAAKELPSKVPRERRQFLCRLIADSSSDRLCERIVGAIPGGRKRALPAYRLVNGPTTSSNNPKAEGTDAEAATNGILYMHGSSVLAKVPPKYLVFAELVETEDKKHPGSTIRFIKNVTAVQPEWFNNSGNF